MFNPLNFDAQVLCSQKPKLPRCATFVEIERHPWDVEIDQLGRYIVQVPLSKITGAWIQRDLKSKRVRQIVDEYIPAMYGNPVGFYELGLVKVVNGNHSTAASQALFAPETMVPVTLVDKTCAYQLFILLNANVEKVSRNDMFYAALKGNDGLAVHVDNYLTSRDIGHIDSSRPKNQITNVPGGMMFARIKYGPTFWEESIDKLLETFDGKSRSLGNTFLEGWLKFHSARKNGSRIAWSRLAKTSAECIYARGKVLGKSSGGINAGIAQALLDTERNYRP